MLTGCLEKHLPAIYSLIPHMICRVLTFLVGRYTIFYPVIVLCLTCSANSISCLIALMLSLSCIICRSIAPISALSSLTRWSSCSRSCAGVVLFRSSSSSCAFRSSLSRSFWCRRTASCFICGFIFSCWGNDIDRSDSSQIGPVANVSFVSC